MRDMLCVMCLLARPHQYLRKALVHRDQLSPELLAAEKKKYQLKGRLGTKPGAWLKHQILIKRFAERQEDRPWFVKVNLVAHVG